jgi:hypothetical protein
MKHTLALHRQPGPKRDTYVYRFLCTRCGHEVAKLDLPMSKRSNLTLCGLSERIRREGLDDGCDDHVAGGNQVANTE